MKYLTRQQIDRLVEAADNPSDKLFLLMSFQHALRVGEAVSITRINVKDGYLCIQREKGSNFTSQPLFENELELMQQVGFQPDGRLFKFRSRHTAWRKIRALGAKVGLDPKLCHPHAFRHGMAIDGLRGGMTIPELQKYLGHAAPGSTLCYLESSEQESCKSWAAICQPKVKSAVAGQ